MAAINWVIDGLLVLAALELIFLGLLAVAIVLLIYLGWRRWVARRIMRSGRW